MLSITAIKHRFRSYPGVFQTTLGASALLILATSLGWLQSFELDTFDLMIRLRPAAPPDERIVVLEVGEEDIKALQQWPLTDDKLAQILEKVQQQNPRVVGLDLYRDLPVPPGNERLLAAIQAMPNLVGVEKVVGQSVAGMPALTSLDQVALADLVLDPDSKVRRGLINLQTSPETNRVGLGAQLALAYLASEGTVPEFVPEDPDAIQIGAARLRPLQPSSGLYRGIDTGGYQVMLDYQGERSSFRQVSMRDLMSDRLPPNTFTNKIVLIGATAPSLNDVFLTPYNTSLAQKASSLPGVYIHATLTRQILAAATEGSGLRRDWPESMEWLWIAGWSLVGAGFTGRMLQVRQKRHQVAPFWLIVSGISVLGGVLFGISYGSFLAGWWIPMASPLMGLVLASVLRVAYQNQVLERLASLDQLTQVANRRRFDQTLHHCLLQNQPLCLILCDVDYFKPFNDTYGHLAGDACLTRVASAIRQSVRGTDLVARYGGEEFAVILPNTHPEIAESIAERIRQQVMGLQIEHRSSQADRHVTLSCGVTSLTKGMMMPTQLIQVADQALYLAKHQGRNSVVLKLAQMEPPDGELAG